MPRLQRDAVVRIAGLIITEPDDTHMAAGVGCDPGKEVGMAPIYRQAHISWVRPGRALIRRERVEDVGVVRPDRVDEPKVIHGKRGEKIDRALILRTRRAGEYLVVGEREYREAHIHVGRDADVNATEGSTRNVLGCTVRCHEDLVEISAAQTTAAIDLDLPCNVGAVGGRDSARG